MHQRTTSHHPRLSQVMILAVLMASPLAAGESRWYVEGKLGQASVLADFGPPDFGWTFDATESAAAVEVGYTINRYFSLQGGFRDLGRYEGLPTPCPDGQICPLSLGLSIPVEADISGLSLSAVPRWPINDRLSIYGKLGVLDWDVDVSPTVSGPAIERFSGRDLLAGAGVLFTFPRRKGLGVLVEYENSDLFDNVSLGASWRF